MTNIAERAQAERADPVASVAERIRATRGAGGPHAFEYRDRGFVVHEGVFSPLHFASTRVFTDNLPFAAGRSFLEIGCGAGVTAVAAALAGCRPVVASDIAAEAVENARLNARLHGVGDVVSVRRGDLFEVLEPGETFDVIYWNSPFVAVPADHGFQSDLERAFFDAGYEANGRYLAEAPRHLAPGGTLLLGFGSLGDEAALRRLCARHGHRISVLASETVGSGEEARRYDLLRLEPDGRGRAA